MASGLIGVGFGVSPDAEEITFIVGKQFVTTSLIAWLTLELLILKIRGDPSALKM